LQYWRNLEATYLSANLVSHAGTKYVEMDYHIVGKQIANKQLDIKFISNKNQVR
jgi:hypothetical protein